MPQNNAHQQKAFADALFQPDSVPDDIIDPNGNAAPKRFSVYKNNVIVSYLEALAAAYPACKALVGEAFFNAIARDFITENPPNSQLMILFGGGFSAFLKTYAPAQQIPFLSDIAAIERAWRLAYHSSDIAPLSHEELAQIPQNTIETGTFTLLQSAHTITSPFPIFDIWQAAQNGTAIDNIDFSIGQSVFVVRPELDVHVYPIDHQSAELISKLQGGKSLSDIAQQFADANTDLDLVAFLTLLVQTRAIAAITPQP
jgi:hypothetical protein